MKKKPGRPPTLTRPNGTFPVVLYTDQVERLDRIAFQRGASRSAVAREAMDLFLAVNRDFVSIPEREPEAVPA